MTASRVLSGGMVALPKNPPIPYRMTLDEFLGWTPEDADTWVWQLVDGEPLAMAPPGLHHGRVQSRTTVLLQTHLDRRGGGCMVATTPGVVPAIRSVDNCRIPDLAVSCDAEAADAKVMRNPVLIVEILSASNEKETWTNVWAYTTIPSVREILVLSLVVPRARVLRRDGAGGWPDEAQVIEGMDAVRLESVDGAWPLTEFYVGTGVPMPRVA